MSVPIENENIQPKPQLPQLLQCILCKLFIQLSTTEHKCESRITLGS
jgi:hypothetical protein